MEQAADLIQAITVLSVLASIIYLLIKHLQHNYRLIQQQSLRAVREEARQRAENINKKVKENSEFKAFCECPKCSTFATHYIKKIRFFGLMRECQNCDFSWRQK